MVDATLIVFMIVTIILLFTAMVISAVASSDAAKGGVTGTEGCRKNSTWAALITGVAVAVIIIILILYIYSSRKHIAGAAQERLASWHGRLGQVAGTAGSPLKSM